MKLFAKYTRVNLIVAIGVLLLGGVCYYFIIRYVLVRQLDDTLKVEEAEILDHVKTKGALPEPTNYRDQQIRFIPADNAPQRRFFYQRQYDDKSREYKPFRQLQFPLLVNGQAYTASVTKSAEEMEDLLALIVLITLGVICLLLLLVFLANRFLLRKAWLPFYHTLQSIQQFNLSNRQSLSSQPTSIDEFRELNLAAGQMTDKILKDYETLKNFADNASHEMQTPLAILNSKLDLLVQGHSLDEKQTRQVHDMYDAVGRLRHLNQSLLLLARIENQQFPDTISLSLRALIEAKRSQFEELIQSAKLQLTLQGADFPVRMNTYLADILLNNLLSNAIRHNIADGYIHILLDISSEPGGALLEISNTGPPLPFATETLFDRFVRGDRSGGTGLGLATVKQICDNYGFSISYRYSDSKHYMTIRF